MTDLAFRTTVSTADRDAISALLTATGVFLASEVAVALDLVDDTLTQGAEASGYHFCCAEQAGQMMGYACYGEVPLTTGSFDLYWLAVAPAVQRTGIARALVAQVAALSRAAGGRALYAETASLPEYAAARAFYARNGFVCLAEFPDFYGVGNDKLVFRLLL